MIESSAVGVTVLILFFLFLVLLGIYVSHPTETAPDAFFFASHSVHSIVLGASFLGAGVSSLCVFVLLAHPSHGIVAIAYGLVSVVMFAILGWKLGPLLLKIGIRTFPEFFEKRFGRNCRYYVSTIYVLSNVFIKLLVVLVLGGLLIRRISGLDPFSPLLFLLFITGIYVVVGGLRAEMYASTILGSFIIVVVLALTVWMTGQSHIEGFASAAAVVPASAVGPALRSNWVDLIFGFPLLGFWFCCGDQFILQKVVSARSGGSLRRGTLLFGILLMIPILAFVAVGGAFFPTVFRDGMSAPELFGNSMPVLLRLGLLFVVGAVVMALLANIFNSTSLLVVFDFYRSLRPSASDRNIILAGRLTTIIISLCSVSLIPLSMTIHFDTSLKLIELFVYFAALVMGIFVIGLLNIRVGSLGAISTLLVVTVIILLKSGMEIFYDGAYGGSAVLASFGDASALDFTVLIFAVTMLLMFGFRMIEGMKLRRPNGNSW